jgi:two-component system sensor histidine kinase PilS (NtrC family)
VTSANASVLARQDPAAESGRGEGPSRFPLRRSRVDDGDARLIRSLSWLIAIRLVVITSVVLPYLLSQLSQLSSTENLPTFDFLYRLAGFTYVASLVYIALLRFLRDRPMLNAFIQFGGDLLVVTGLVYFFGGIGSPFSLFYLVVIMTASVMLRRRAGLIVATAAYLLYASLMAALVRHRLPAVEPSLSEQEVSWRLPYNLAVHLFGFYAVALLTSYLAENVRRAEEELEEQRGELADLEVLHRDVVQSISSGVATADLEGRITSVNRAGCEILGHSEPELLGHPIEELGLIRREEWIRLASLAAEEARPLRSEGEVVRRGESFPVGFGVSALTDATGTANGSVLVFQDLSDRRRLEEELRLKDRMAAVGELAAGIAHEVGNPLAAISGSVQLLSQSRATDDSQRRLLEIILKESQRLDRTIKGFLRFAKPRERSSESFDVAALLTENTSLLRNSPERRENHAIDLELDPPSAQMLGDRDQLSQIFWNLAQNALRAMPEGGRLLITGTRSNDRYRLEFQDTGRGMTDEQRARLFQPFRSFFDRGTGIGMAIVYRIVQEHEGRIGVESAVGRGTRITIELPTRIPTPLQVGA